MSAMVLELSKEKWFVIKVVISLLLLLVLVQLIGISSLITSIQLIGLPLFAGLIGMAVVILVLNILAVWVLYQSVATISFRQFLPAFMRSWVVGFFSPGKIGSLSLAVLLKQQVKPGVSAAIFVIDKLITVVLALVIGAFFLFQFVDLRDWILIVGGVLIGLIGISLLLLTHPGRALIRQIGGKYTAYFEGFAVALPLFVKRPQGLIWNGVLTLIRSGVQAISLVFIFAALGYHASWWDSIALASSENLASLIPITLSGIGLRESVLAALGTQIGIPFTVGVSAGIVMTTITISTVILSAIYVALTHKK